MKALLFANQLHGFKALSNDGAIGHVDEFYFDDQSWRIRYCVVDIGSWISDRKVLISPAAISGFDWHDKGVVIKETKDQIEKSLAASAELPVARVLEAQIHRHYGWDFFWPELFATPEAYAIQEESSGEGAMEHDPHLRSTKVLTGISLVTDADADFGNVHDFVVDSESWSIAFIEVNQSKPGRLLLSTDLVRNIDVSTRKIQVASPW